ncbi:MAG TPA: beta-ketoacyl-ACP synthase II [Thermoflexales bacterium]|nr:beta-ketoacyl-ACP synthase II [Thermoflexales bacterium]HQW33894.1 beta-ketoacyl-ACP synthase II [Thermoflexales bacterium]HQZ22631.1 beta-ketoacyl-ACP synthase II [Thermoflexales bacterium]HQZ99385.1 beta-ketoacyl-ACP synthase II [Thermoflexales bacterium]
MKRFSGLTKGVSRIRSYAGEKLDQRRMNRDARKMYAEIRNSHHQRRAVITGIGAITPLGLSTAETWAGLAAGRSGIGPITLFDPSNLPVHIAGEVKGFDPLKYIEPKESRRMARVSHFAVAAAQEARLQSGLVIGKDIASERVGVVMGTALGGFDTVDTGLQEYRKLGLRRTNPFALPAALPNAPGHHISTEMRAKGPLNTVVAACASGTQAIGDAAELIRRGAADAVFAGGVEASVIEGAIVAFSLMRVLSSHYNDTPQQAAKPFDVRRDGFVFSEGCVVMMVEEYERARARGAHIYAEVLGMGVSSDAYHIAIPDPEAGGAIRAMEWALQDAGVDPDEIDYINAHGSGTATNDVLETKAIKHVFGDHARKLAISSTKSMMGHAMGGAGAIEALATVLSMEHNLLTPTINLEQPDPECDLDYVPNVAREARVDIAMSNSFGLGGQNACVVFGKVN